jgi:hypothetical protein
MKKIIKTIKNWITGAETKKVHKEYWDAVFAKIKRDAKLKYKIEKATEQIAEMHKIITKK